MVDEGLVSDRGSPRFASGLLPPNCHCAQPAGVARFRGSLNSSNATFGSAISAGASTVQASTVSADGIGWTSPQP